MAPTHAGACGGAGQLLPRVMNRSMANDPFAQGRKERTNIIRPSSPSRLTKVGLTITTSRTNDPARSPGGAYRLEK
jgi:hypothetical protein